MYVITGATGNTGSGIAEALLARGEKVRVVGRSAEKLERFVQKGAEALSADLGDEAALARAFAGATAVYVMIPPDPTSEHWREQQERQSDALAAALQKSGATYAVTLSSVGADKAEKVGPVVGLHSLEEKLNRIAGLNVLHLRAGYFMENLLQYVGLIKTMGMLAGTLRSDLPIAMIANLQSPSSSSSTRAICRAAPSVATARSDSSADESSNDVSAVRSRAARWSNLR